MVIKVFTKPASKLDKIQWKENILHVHLRALPIDGEANIYLIKYLANFFEVSQSNIALTKGHRSKHKFIKIEISQEKFESKFY